jgi:ribosome-binding factor A
VASERRQRQVEKRIQHEKRIQQKVSELLLFELKDPRMGFVTVTGVSIGRDLAVATVRWSVLDRKEKSKVAHALEHAHGFLRREVARDLDIRSAPDLKFEYDDGAERAERIEQRLREVMPPEDRTPGGGFGETEPGRDG